MPFPTRYADQPTAGLVAAFAAVRLALAQPGAEFYAYDQVAWVGALGHQEADAESLAGALDLFEALRTFTLAVFHRATAEPWDHAVRHPEHGPVTLRNLLELYADHGERHLEQMVECRRLLGRPLELPPILVPRLF